jgi:Leucine-rich repeat (LRR) protein
MAHCLNNGRLYSLDISLIQDIVIILNYFNIVEFQDPLLEGIKQVFPQLPSNQKIDIVIQLGKNHWLNPFLLKIDWKWIRELQSPTIKKHIDQTTVGRHAKLLPTCDTKFRSPNNPHGLSQIMVENADIACLESLQAFRTQTFDLVQVFVQYITPYQGVSYIRFEDFLNFCRSSQCRFHGLYLKNLDFTNFDFGLFSHVKFMHLSSGKRLQLRNINSLSQMERLEMQDMDLELLPALNLPKIRILNLSHNRIMSVRSFLRDSELPTLEELDLSYNRVQDVGKIMRMPSLKVLNMAYHALSDLDFLVGSSLRSLQELHLEHGLINEISSVRTLTSSPLRILDLSNNRLWNLSAFSGIAFPDLQYLFLAYNQLLDVEPLTQLKVLQLKELGLEGNEAAMNPVLIKWLKTHRPSWNVVTHRRK